MQNAGSPRYGLYSSPESAICQCVALVAQLVEHLICNQGVAGSNPAGGTNKISFLAEISLVFRVASCGQKSTPEQTARVALMALS